MADTIVTGQGPGTLYASVVEATEIPRIVRLSGNLYAAVFSLMKLLPAHFILDQAEASGALTPGTPVLETSSGTFGLGLALLCCLRGYPLTIVGDAVIDQQLKTRMEMLGARVEIVADNGHPGGVQGARLDRLDELRRQQPGCFVPDQYNNPDNARSYGQIGELVAGSVGPVDCLVGAVGSGGSTGGLIGALRAHRDVTRLIGVDTHGSVIFGLPPGPRLLRGLGSSIIPGNVRHALYDEVHWVTAAEADHATRELYREHGLFMGPTSGASYLVARWWAGQHPKATVLAVFPDDGYRYQASVYGSDWLVPDHRLKAGPNASPDPVLVEHPGEAPGRWTRFGWDRRTLAAVINAGLPR